MYVLYIIIALIYSLHVCYVIPVVADVLGFVTVKFENFCKSEFKTVDQKKFDGKYQNVLYSEWNNHQNCRNDCSFKSLQQ